MGKKEKKKRAMHTGYMSCLPSLPRCMSREQRPSHWDDHHNKVQQEERALGEHLPARDRTPSRQQHGDTWHRLAYTCMKKTPNAWRPTRILR